MYCKYCGRQTDDKDGVCDRCKQPVLPVAPKSKKGVRIAISSFITSIVSLVVVMVAFGFLFSVMIEVAKNGYTDESITSLIIYLIATLLIMGVSIVVLVLGIKAIKTFARAKRNKENPQVIVLVFGIISIAISAFVLIYAFVLSLFPIIMLTTRIIPTVTINGVPV